MALEIPFGFGQAVYRFSLTGDNEEMLTTLGVAMIGSYANPQVAADGLRGEFIAGFPAANILTGYTFIGVRFIEGVLSGPSPVFESTGAPVVGTNAGPALPPNSAFLVTKRSAKGGRAHRGRMYLPAGIGVGEDSVPATGVMLEAQRGILQGRVNTAFANGEKVIFHDSLTPGGFDPTVITAFLLQARLATQRRRLRP
jgi:PAB1-binding protein PBP1